MSLVSEFHWTPKTVSNMFCDDLDHHGIIYWYELIKEQSKERDSKFGK
ncbi:hypothetical protein [Zunongwangia sp. HRR-M8]|nr:hypothetical protein [Zunongwangia sp. HRR-M8]WBL22961.1 hypothetical protein PBT89_03145 [Zunongwangia sp. HRR-M8]